MLRYTLFIDGREVEAASGHRYESMAAVAAAVWVELTGGTRDPFTLG
jgi:hypothetical protein